MPRPFCSNTLLDFHDILTYFFADIYLQKIEIISELIYWKLYYVTTCYIVQAKAK